MIRNANHLAESFIYMLIFILIAAGPIIVTIMEASFLLKTAKKPDKITPQKKTSYFIIDLIAVFFSIILELVYLDIFEVKLDATWQTQLHNAQKHQPIFTDSLPTIITIILLAVVALCVLNLINVNKVPPLIPVIAMSFLYMGVILGIVFAIQIIDVNSRGLFEFYLFLPPIGYILISLRAILKAVREYAPSPDRMSKIDGSNAFSSVFGLLKDANKWPILALILALPLLGILICILMLCGQAPNSVINAFTETADFRLSQKIPPQQIYYDEHYLCTVAAGGDRKIVKPLRMGIRHGHPVVVNRQLCIANAFEQILEERTPRFHRIVRSFYDKYGFPVSKMIKSKFTADIIYFIMKPLEWIFLIFLYLTDVHPEDRIALQYTGKSRFYNHR